MTEFTYSGSDGTPLHAVAIESTSPAPPLVLLHGGGPDHRMFLPLAQELSDLRRIILPDIRGYGRSVCTEPSLHTWSCYTDDVISLLDHLGDSRAVLGGAGLGSTIALRTAVAHPDRVAALILVSVEDIENDGQKQAEVQLMDDFAERVWRHGIQAGWEPLFADLAPLIGNLVREAIPRSSALSVAAAAAIGRDRSFRNVGELAGVAVPTIIFGGMDYRHPFRVAEELASHMSSATLWQEGLPSDVSDANGLAQFLAPPVRDFLDKLER